MATHSSVLAWRIPGTGKPGGLPPMGSHRVGHDWSDLATAAASSKSLTPMCMHSSLTLPVTVSLLKSWFHPFILSLTPTQTIFQQTCHLQSINPITISVSPTSLPKLDPIIHHCNHSLSYTLTLLSLWARSNISTLVEPKYIIFSHVKLSSWILLEEKSYLNP